MLRTGHDYLRRHLHHRFHAIPNDKCFCHLPGQDIYHLLNNCPYPLISNWRQVMITAAKLTIDEHNALIADVDSSAHIFPETIDFLDPNTYLYPDQRLSTTSTSRLMALIITLYRLARGHRPSPQHCLPL